MRIIKWTLSICPRKDQITTGENPIARNLQYRGYFKTPCATHVAPRLKDVKIDIIPLSLVCQSLVILSIFLAHRLV